MRERITVTSEMSVFRLCETCIRFRCGKHNVMSLKDAVELAICDGDCGKATHVILDGVDHGSLWSLGFDPSVKVFKAALC